MRLRDFDGSVISPAVFILAEQTGAIHQLGRWASREQACHDIANYGMGDVVSVNVSAMQLKTPGFPLQVTEIIGQFGISPAQACAGSHRRY